MHGVEEGGALAAEASVDEAFGLVEPVGPLGDGGGGAQQEDLGQRLGRLGEEGPDPVHRRGRRDQAGGGLVADEERLSGGADQVGRAFGGLAQPAVHLLSYALVVVGEQRGGGLDRADQVRVARQVLVAQPAQHVDGGAGLAPAGQGRAEGDRRVDAFPGRAGQAHRLG